MNQSDTNARVARLRSNHFLGFVRLNFSQISFIDTIHKGHREESPKATARLLRVFQLQGCERDSLENFIDALIPLHVFHQAIGTDDASSFQDWRRVKRLELSHPVQCLEGLHRISAATAHLPFNDRWWNVRLFSLEGGLEAMESF